MNPVAAVLMIVVQVTVTAITGYFFWRVLKTPPKSESEKEE
ncbi:MAG TPA: hypothetical protein VKA08_03510 [Balneolales bacterium]|nr:hypothetical protein [Balneolales bacterium]